MLELIMQRKKEIVTDIVLIDIIGFSILDSLQQLEIISFLTRSYRKVIEKIVAHTDLVLENFIIGFIPTGDGFYCILDPKYTGFGSILGLSFNHFSEQITRMFPYFRGVRIAVHTGTIYEFTDILGHKNFIGEGLNDCARYLEFKDFTISTVMVSDLAYQHLKEFLDQREDYKKLLHEQEFKRSNVYLFQDKHKQTKKGYLIWVRKSGIIIPPKYRL